ncbi:histamine N-methyltransferase B [Exaiptasia diaphana]|uniref:Histamine N-methyltransferase n=1 Tax=Exaiptasia diaphana TaxID=2652724 RepID=A0A913Y0S0_EXADI|nr:histamine N-methyltransferase B [Exaiptasia diaphana]
MDTHECFHWKGTEENFMKSFNVFLGKSGQVCKVINSLRLHLPSTLKYILDEPNPHDGINILSIGSGDGDMDIEILKIVNEEMQRHRPGHAVKMFNRAVEPQVHALNQYKNTVATRLPKELSNASVVFDIDRPESFEEYVTNIKETVEFDIIHFIHSIYHITDVEKALKHCYEKGLGNRGAIVLLLAGKDDTIQLLRKRTTCEIIHFGSDIVEIVRQNGWRHEVYRKDYFTDVTQVFDEESIEGNLLLDFFAHSEDFRLNDDHEKVKITLDCIKEMSTFEDGKFLAKKHEDVLIIFK